MKKTLDEKLAEARARGEHGKAAATAAAPAKQLMLPLWPEAVHGVPNAVLRGALFSVSQEREQFKVLTPIAAVDGIEISIQNARLNQHDLDLFEMLLHVQRAYPLGERVHFTAHTLLKALGRGTSGQHHKDLRNDMARLIGSVIEIRWTAEKKRFMGTLVERAYIDDETGRWVIEFSPELLTLYSQGHTWIDWVERRSLGRNHIAKWLHGFYASHAQPYAYSVDMLWKLTGSNAPRNEFRRKLRAALDALVKIGTLTSWEIDENDLVQVKRKPSLSQKKHLLGRQKKR